MLIYKMLKINSYVKWWWTRRILCILKSLQNEINKTLQNTRVQLLDIFKCSVILLSKFVLKFEDQLIILFKSIFS